MITSAFIQPACTSRSERLRLGCQPDWLKVCKIWRKTTNTCPILVKCLHDCISIMLRDGFWCFHATCQDAIKHRQGENYSQNKRREFPPCLECHYHPYCTDNCDAGR